MSSVFSVRVHASFVTGLVLIATPAFAQFQPRPVPETIATALKGERYHFEFSAGFWRPSADLAIASERFGITGSQIDFKEDLGLTDQRFGELHFVIRPATKHKFRGQYIPIKYQQGPITAARDLVFNGQLYPGGVRVNSVVEWKAYRFGYEYDFLVLPRGFGGFVVDIKYTDMQATLTAPPSLVEFVDARAPIPAIGGIFRVYPATFVSITGEITGFKMPERVIEDTTGRYVDIDFYGTVNLTNNIGAKIGYRSFDLGYVVESDVGDFKLKGFYFGGVVRY
jgi:hypothetical protein